MGAGIQERALKASELIISLYKKYQSKHGRLMFGVSHANSFLKKKGFNKDVRRFAWEILESCGLIIRHKQSAVLVPAIMRTPSEKRVKLLPAQVILKFKKLSSEVLGSANKEYNRIETLDLLAKKKIKRKKKRKTKVEEISREEELKMQEEYIKSFGVTECPTAEKEE